MRLNKKHIMYLAARHGLTQNQLAHELDISKSSLSNILSGRRGAGPTVIIGLLRVFPEETVFSVTGKDN